MYLATSLADAPVATDSDRVTHVLIGHLAYPVSNSKIISHEAGGTVLIDGEGSDPKIVVGADATTFDPGNATGVTVNGEICSGPVTLVPGMTISLQDHADPLVAISEKSGDGT